MLNQAELVVLARQAALKYQLPAELVCAICEQESAWNPWAIRFEPAFELRYIHPALPNAPTTEELMLAMSWGLMQVMGQVAREFGFTNRFLTELCDPETGLEVGCKVLAHKIAVNQGNLTHALLAWNGGGDPAYAQEVLARVGKYNT